MKFTKAKVALVVVVLCLLPVTTIYSVSACKSREVTCLLLVETPEKQVVVDEIIDAIESLGLTIDATYYYDYDEWVAYAQVHGMEYDLTYGGLVYSWFIDDIFQVAFLLNMYNTHLFQHDDKKLDRLVNDLYGMFEDAMATPEIVTEEYLDDMTKIFNKIEKRLFYKQYMLQFVQWEGFFAPFGMNILFTDSIGLNAEKGRVFHSTFYRWALYSLIDRDVFMDYHALYNPEEAYEVYHLFQISALHDTTLPNW